MNAFETEDKLNREPLRLRRSPVWSSKGDDTGTGEAILGILGATTDELGPGSSSGMSSMLEWRDNGVAGEEDSGV
jgi:hypothetical protein